MIPRPPGVFRVTLLLARTALRRRANKFGAFRRKRGEARSAVGRKSGRRGALLLLLFGGLMLLQAFAMSNQCVSGFVLAIEARHGETPAASVDRAQRALGAGFREAPDWVSGPESERTLLVLLGGTLSVLSVAILFTTLGAAKQDLGRVAWSTEWLFTFPVPPRALFFARVGEYALTDLFSWVAVFPFLTVVFVRSGRGGFAPLLGALGTLAVASLLASLRLTIETWLRKRFSLSRLKNVQAACTVLGLLLLFVSLSLALRHPIPEPVLDAAARVPLAALWFPFAQPVLLAASAVAFAPLVVFAAVGVAAGVGLSARFVRDGLVAHAGSVARGCRGAPREGRPFLRGILGKEIRLLLRDRNFFVQTLLLPIFVIGFQALVNPSLFGHGAGLTGAIVAYGVGAYVLMFGAFSVLAVERESLWLLYTFPQSLARLLRRKAKLWALTASLYTVAVLSFWRPGTDPDLRTLVAPAMALVGTILSAFLAAGIAALGTDPFEDRPNRRVGTQFVYLYLFLATAFGYGIWTHSLWVKFVLVVLYSLLVVALWQKAEERLPLLLDPTVSPPKRISLADGLIYALVFFLIQAISFGVYRIAGAGSPDLAVLLSFVTAGFVTVLVALSALPAGTLGDILRYGASWRHRPFRSRYLGAGVVTGAAAGCVGLGWMLAMEQVDVLREARNQWMRLSGAEGPTSLVLFGVLAVAAAPLFEEFLFRGLVFRGLGRVFGPRTAMVASALLFAVVHPPMAFPAVFTMGFAAAWIYRRTRSLPAAMAVHATYNAIVLFLAALVSVLAR